MRTHEICDYSDTNYQAFWAEGRDYEDAVERIAIRKLTADFSGDCIEIGAGFGRLAEEYAPRCRSVLLTDRAEHLLDEARERMAKLGLTNVRCENADLYELAQLGQTFDAAVCVRVLHHVECVQDFFSQVYNVLKPGGLFVLEYANKRNALEIARCLVGRSTAKPFDHEPTRRSDSVYYNFHPAYVEQQLREAGFEIVDRMAVSLFRSAKLKSVFGKDKLVRLERPLQHPMGKLKLTPSVFLKLRKI